MIDEATAAAAARQAAELILQDEALTAGLPDAEADAVLRWALAAAERVLATRLQSGAPVDRSAVAEAVQPLRQAARSISELVARHGAMDQGQFLTALLALIDAACRSNPAL